MTPKQITKWARKAGIYLDGANQRQPLYVAKPEELQAFAQLVRNATLEEAAVECESLYAGLRIQPTRSESSEAIRKLKS
jgi:hypothetical protein